MSGEAEIELKFRVDDEDEDSAEEDERESMPIESETFRLEIETELRFEVHAQSKVTLELKSGKAEIFGTELVLNKKYAFASSSKTAAFTWHGCTIQLVGKTEVAYIAKETPMVIYTNIHAAIEDLRQKAEEENTRGPNVLVCGPCDVGKSTLCRILLNYAVRMGRRPAFVDLDVGQGHISVPGTIGALIIEETADIEEGFSQRSPLVYHFGHKSPGNNMSLYNTLAAKIAEKLNSHVNGRSGVSGMIINTCGWVKGPGYHSITQAALTFEVDAILVIDHERLYDELVRDMPSFVKVVYVPKSSGIIERSQSVRAEARDNRIRDYFYGRKIELHPHSFDVKFSDMKLYKIGNTSTSEFYDTEDNTSGSGQNLVPVQIGPGLINHIVSVSFAESLEENVIQTNVAGFICITNVDLVREVITLLSPDAGPLPNNVFLVGEVKFFNPT